MAASRSALTAVKQYGGLLVRNEYMIKKTEVRIRLERTLFFLT
jgi:hypothetical protein